MAELQSVASQIKFKRPRSGARCITPVLTGFKRGGNMQKILDNIEEGIKRGKEKARLNSELNMLLALANTRMRKIHAILTDQAIEWVDFNGAVTGYTAQIDQETFKRLMNLSNGLKHDES
jgi:hypothetical protein